MNQLPLISVVVPVYKVEKYLDQCIRSIVNQTYQNLEILLVDDGSPDSCGAICDSWANRDPRIRVIHQANGGGGKARNAALDVAQGGWIAFVDSDDYIAADMLEYLYGLTGTGADIAECGYVLTQTDDAAFEAGYPETEVYGAAEAMRCHIRDTAYRQLIWNKLYRRTVVAGVRFVEGTKIDDEYFTYRVLGNARKLIRSDRKCYAYRQQPGSVMHQKDPVKCRESMAAKQQRLAYLQKHFPELVGEAKRELLMTCIYCLQAYQKELKGVQRKEAQDSACQVIRELLPVDVSGADSGKQKLLMKLAQKAPRGTAALLNFLIDIHILT